MSRDLKQIALAMIFIGISCLGFEANACVCGPQATPYEAFHDARAVFVGKVVSFKDREETEQLGDETNKFTVRIFQFQVSESFKGPRNSKLDISAGRLDSSCY